MIITRTLLAAVALVTATCALAQNTQWPTYNNGYDSQRFSPLKQITTGNVTQLGEVCRVQVDGPTSFHAGLVVSGNTIYTGTSRETYALDAQSCAVKWKYTWQSQDARCGGGNRGFALLNNRLFRGTCDGHLIALDASNGKLLWQNLIAVTGIGESTPGAPLAWQNTVYMGVAGSELGIRGRVMAFDAESGHELWRFNTIPMGNDVGANTWKKPETAKTGGGGVWGAMTLDISARELFVPVGNPWPDLVTGYRPGDNLFTNSIVVLDALTGQLKWWHQVAPADFKDLDLVAAPVIFRTEGARDYLIIGGKDGYVTGVDRDTRKQVFRTAVTTVEDLVKAPSKEPQRLCPGYAGGVEWNGPALDKLNNTLIVGAVDVCFIVKLSDSFTYKPGEAEFGGTIENDGTGSGWITALESTTGKIKWQYHTEKPVVAGITPTAGGVTFAGDLSGTLFAFDSQNGKVLHKVNTGGAMAGGVVTYEINGKQYLAFASGNISRNAFGDVGLPSVVIMTLNPGAPATKLDGTSASSESGIANGRRLFSQVCSSCHGVDGNLLGDHKLGSIAKRLSPDAVLNAVKNPKAPMPKLWPELLNEQSVQDVVQFVLSELK